VKESWAHGDDGLDGGGGLTVVRGEDELGVPVSGKPKMCKSVILIIHSDGF
jgi:hypothetical protein